MPKKQTENQRSVYVKFTRPDDIELLNRLTEDAKMKRYDVATYILLVLLEAYPKPTYSTDTNESL
jgi:hypothetical protein